MTQPAVPTYVVLVGSHQEQYRRVVLSHDHDEVGDIVSKFFLRAREGMVTHVSAHADGAPVMTYDLGPEESDDRLIELIYDLVAYVEEHPEVRGVVLDNLESDEDIIQISMVR
jgi:hypothetical protein